MISKSSFCKLVVRVKSTVNYEGFRMFWVEGDKESDGSAFGFQALKEARLTSLGKEAQGLKVFGWVFHDGNSSDAFGVDDPTVVSAGFLGIDPVELEEKKCDMSEVDDAEGELSEIIIDAPLQDVAVFACGECEGYLVIGDASHLYNHLSWVLDVFDDVAAEGGLEGFRTEW
jgi:hypothetical protein